MKYIIANWKANKNHQEVRSWLDGFLSSYEADEQQTVLIAPPFPYLSQVATQLSSLEQVKLAAQDVSGYPLGSYTGAVAVSQLADLGVEFVIVGHSERRRYFHETHQDVARKVSQCLEAGLTPIVCVDQEYIEQQALVLESSQLKKCIVAYEPLVAIGSGENASVKEVKAVTNEIKNAFGNVPVLYGGSVDGENVDDYIELVDGFLIGTASLDAEDFLKVLATVKRD